MFEFMGVCVSTAHMTEKDASILQALVTNYCDRENYNEWIHSTSYGFIVRMYFFKKRLLALKRAGLSKLFRKNLLIMYQEKGYQCYHFDCDADCYPDLDISGL
ncbi:TPA: DUF5983 family protein [Klebsiella pneumoniae]|nr:hypothetical protein [Klebsiella pneumoniae]HCK0334647.1 hypothetical protein [Klebsiella pneumoniae]HDH0429155.1 hypothetical protein [Klebsiella pneumoniae]HDH0511556.1 hypothetical protein [Klebsiella pneumoniae]HDS8296595.1 hypothetical protein [Klebsiella pneumoniae]